MEENKDREEKERRKKERTTSKEGKKGALGDGLVVMNCHPY
jgi:hypothetical protein